MDIFCTGATELIRTFVIFLKGWPSFLKALNDDDHLKGEAGQGAGEVVQAGAGQVTCRFEFHLRFSDDQIHLYIFCSGVGELFLIL